MISLKTFINMERVEQMDQLGEHGTFLTVAVGLQGYDLFYALGEFYVQITLSSFPSEHVRLKSFTAKDPSFNELLASIPMEIGPIEHIP